MWQINLASFDPPKIINTDSTYEALYLTTWLYADRQREEIQLLWRPLYAAAVAQHRTQMSLVPIKDMGHM